MVLWVSPPSTWASPRLSQVQTVWVTERSAGARPMSWMKV